MQYDKAIKLAQQALEKECKRLAANANLADLYGATNPACLNASKQRKELREAIEALGQRRMGL
jgi:Mlc titration factor MtfA (ptsG expression regulator)